MAVSIKQFTLNDTSGEGDVGIVCATVGTEILGVGSFNSHPVIWIRSDFDSALTVTRNFRTYRNNQNPSGTHIYSCEIDGDSWQAHIYEV